ncbi:ferric reductase-like transmembrane domain-containing protein [Actinoplanes couchii]|uniref:ferric reductase-like transmembrane domain-containing protein n=1 Tax=Actinoplanes couchii TaxID=403638 RepID=UPI0019422E9B|nr:ferric reductase-like transmembrane domain-containing protein [Actinoplanes couchii]MDR6324642.1 sulfoxide reductase heme-binding subunit YedZ [Actinoplanes couchii]
MSDDILWYFARGTGVVSLVLLTVVVALGVGARSGRTAFGLPRFAVNLLHRNAALLSVLFLAGHVIALLFDSYANLDPIDLVVPFVGSYRPFWLGLGTVALDLLAAIVITSLLRHRLGARTWRIVHWLAYLSWPIALPTGWARAATTAPGGCGRSRSAVSPWWGRRWCGVRPRRSAASRPATNAGSHHDWPFRQRRPSR